APDRVAADNDAVCHSAIKARDNTRGLVIHVVAADDAVGAGDDNAGARIRVIAVVENRIATNRGPRGFDDDAGAEEDHLVMKSVVDDRGIVVGTTQEDAVEEVAVDVVV